LKHLSFGCSGARLADGYLLRRSQRGPDGSIRLGDAGVGLIHGALRDADIILGLATVARRASTTALAELATFTAVS